MSDPTQKIRDNVGMLKRTLEDIKSWPITNNEAEVFKHKLEDIIRHAERIVEKGDPTTDDHQILDDLLASVERQLKRVTQDPS